jgi:methyltransferase (TIGR00027 family)
MNVRTFVAAAVYGALEVLLFPFALAGYVLYVIKLILYTRRSGASATLLASFYTRWMQHQLGTRRDLACHRLMMVLPNSSSLGLWLTSGATILAHRLTGYVPRLYQYPYPGVPPMQHQPAARTTFFDFALERHLASIDQLVVLGAGLDTRSYRLPKLSHPVRCFEVDTPKTQAFKRQMLDKADLDVTNVTFVPADFQHEDWFARLLEAGFDPRRRSFFLWESVTMYLDRPTVESTLRTIAQTADGTAIAFDYFSVELLQQRSMYWRYANAVLKMVGEPFGTFGIDTTPPVRQHVAEFVESCGLSLEEQRNFGDESDQRHPEGGFATAIVQRAS